MPSEGNNQMSSPGASLAWCRRTARASLGRDWVKSGLNVPKEPRPGRRIPRRRRRAAHPSPTGVGTRPLWLRRLALRAPARARAFSMKETFSLCEATVAVASVGGVPTEAAGDETQAGSIHGDGFRSNLGGRGYSVPTSPPRGCLGGTRSEGSRIRKRRARLMPTEMQSATAPMTKHTSREPKMKRFSTCTPRPHER